MSTKQYLAVATGGKATVAGAWVKILGVLQDKPDAADKAAQIMVHGRTKGIAGAAITAGVELEVDANGKYITPGFLLQRPLGEGSTGCTASGSPSG